LEVYGRPSRLAVRTKDRHQLVNMQLSPFPTVTSREPTSLCGAGATL